MLLGGGDRGSAVRSFSKFGSAEEGRFTDRGRQVHADAEASRQALQAVTMPCELREQPDAPWSTNEIGQLRSETRALQWLATRGDVWPGLSTSVLQSRAADGTVQDLVTLSKFLRRRSADDRFASSFPLGES